MILFVLIQPVQMAGGKIIAGNHNIRLGGGNRAGEGSHGPQMMVAVNPLRGSRFAQRVPGRTDCFHPEACLGHGHCKTGGGKPARSRGNEKSRFQHVDATTARRAAVSNGGNTWFRMPEINKPKAPVRNVSDTARWVACFRARETKRPDALFHDPFAERLAGELGVHIANTLADGNKHDWAWAARTYLFDRFLTREIQAGADLVINLAAGLDARPYRMQLPAALRWVEVDLPEIIAYKEEILAGEKPHCGLERISLDLTDVEARNRLFAELDSHADKIAVASEGLLIYFTPEAAGSLARDLACGKRFQSWIIDLASPGQLKLMQRTTGKQLSEAGAAFRFGPPEGPEFFMPHGWEAAEVQGLLKTAAQFQRSPAELQALLPEPKGPMGNYPWTGVCLLHKRRSLPHM